MIFTEIFFLVLAFVLVTAIAVWRVYQVLEINPIESRWAFLNLLALLFLLILTEYVSYVVVLEWPMDIPFPQVLVLARASTLPGVAANHSVIDVMFLASAWVFVALGSRGKRLESMLREKHGIFAALTKGVFIGGVHEGLWYATWLLVYPFSPMMLPPHVASTWLILSPVILVIYSKLHGFGKKEMIYILAMIGMYALWASVGFPVTLQFWGATQFFSSVYVNALEVGSWLYACVLWIAFAIRCLRGRVQKSRKLEALRM